jgi:deazaflavin-dependent oxidoreductase (nitroreductase family)
MTTLTTRSMTPPPRPAREAPALVRLSNPLTRRLLRSGLPMGPNVLLTVRGRVSGEPRTAPVAVVEIDGRRYVIGAYGDVQWVRNLRVAGEADLHIAGKLEHVIAIELNATEATRFYGETVPSYVARFPWFGRLFAHVFFRLALPEIAIDPARAAEAHPVFELRSA